MKTRNLLSAALTLIVWPALWFFWLAALYISHPNNYQSCNFGDLAGPMCLAVLTAVVFAILVAVVEHLQRIGFLLSSLLGLASGAIAAQVLCGIDRVSWDCALVSSIYGIVNSVLIYFIVLKRTQAKVK